MIEQLLDPVRLAFGLTLKQTLNEAGVEQDTYKAHRTKRVINARPETLKPAIDYVIRKLHEADKADRQTQLVLLAKLVKASDLVSEQLYAHLLKTALLDFAKRNSLDFPDELP
jgi:hypothetical protein